MSQVRVTRDQSPIHCIDVADTRGDRQVRIRPSAGGITFEFSDLGPTPVWLSADDVEELATAMHQAALRYPPKDNT